MTAAEKVLDKSEQAGMLSWTDAEHLISQGIPSVVFGPGKLSLCHTAAEQVTLSDVQNASRVMQQLIQDVVGQDSICPPMDQDQVED